jgi:hypothetical protein
MPEIEVEAVTSYFNRISVAGVELTGPLKVGEQIRISGATTNLEQVVESMQLDNVSVKDGAADQQVGIRVAERVRPGDRVYRLTP